MQSDIAQSALGDLLPCGAEGIAVVFAPAIGPTLGGWITDNFTWRWVFLLDVPVGILLSLLAGARARPRRSATSFYNVKEFAFVDGRSLGFPPKDLHNLEAMPPEDLDPCYEDRGTTYHRVERLEGLLLAEPLHPFHQELQVVRGDRNLYTPGAVVLA